MKRSGNVLIWVAIFCALAVAHGVRGQTEVTAENLRDVHIRAAMRAIVEELHARKLDNTLWEPTPYPGAVAASQSGGYSALVVLALLYAGETYQGEGLADAVKWLEDLEMGGTYAVSIRAHIWAMLPPKFESLLAKDKTWLLEGFSEQAGGWNYEQEPYTTRRDNSITQYGSLALWEAAKRGVGIEKRYWQLLEDRFINMQLADGGWNYTGTGPATGSMTTAGLTVLFITQDFLHADEAVTLGRAGGGRNQAAIERGLEWMNNNFTAATNPGRDTDFYYYMYGVERVGLASGYKFFGPHDWYREGAAHLIARLCDWDPETETMRVYRTLGGDPGRGELQTVDLAFALMFLSRGRVPVSINKLSGPKTIWNNRPRDVANLNAHISQRTETGLNWQIVSLEAEPEAWLDAPLLYFASNEPPPWIPRGKETIRTLIDQQRAYRQAVARGTDPDELESPLDAYPELAKVKRYLDLGGTLFAAAEGRTRGFAEAIEDAGRILYPHRAWRDLPSDHHAYTLYQRVRQSLPRLRGLSNGVRELIILSAESDFSEAFQGRAEGTESRFDTAMNLYLYASEMNRAKPRVELHTLQQPEPVRVTSVPVNIVRASHSGDWDAEPLALDVFAAWAWNERGFDVQILTQPLATIGKLTMKPALVFVSGTAAIELTDAERVAIKAYVEGGGIILFENAGGGQVFTLALEKQLREMFSRPIRSLLRNPILTGEGIARGADARRLQYRSYSRRVFGARETMARLRGMVFDNNEARVLFSREDISHGLLNQPVWGVSGYTPKWARTVLSNVVQYGRSLAGR